MARHPIEDDSNPALMQMVHKPLKILRRAVTARHSVKSGDLIPPGFIQGMLLDGHQFHVRETHFQAIGSKLFAKFAIIKKMAFALLPGAEMHFIDIQGLLQGLLWARLSIQPASFH